MIDALPPEEREYYKDILRGKNERLHVEEIRKAEFVQLGEDMKQAVNSSSKQNDKILKAIDAIDVKVPEVQKTKQINPQKEVKVVNLQEMQFPNTFQISKIEEQEWLVSELRTNTDRLEKSINGIFGTFDIFDPESPVAVRLSDGNKFITQLTRGVGNIISKAPLQYTTSFASGGKESRALVDTDGHIQVDVLTSPGVSVTVPPAVEVAPTFDHGGKTGIGISAIQITGTSIAATFGVQLKAGNSNAGIIYIGNSDVTSGAADVTDGFELGAGEGMLLKVDTPTTAFAIGSTANQRLFYFVV